MKASSIAYYNCNLIYLLSCEDREGNSHDEEIYTHSTYSPAHHLEITNKYSHLTPKKSDSQVIAPHVEPECWKIAGKKPTCR